jgi:DNA-binding transcriptional MerR regulator
MREDGRYQIGYVADQVGLSLRTVRYYEEVGLVRPSGRTEGGFRLYTDDDVARLQLVKQLKPLEFSLEELGDLLDVRDRLDHDGADDDERGELTQRLAGYVEVAEQRCDELRTQLATVEDVTQRLRQQIRAHRRRRSRAAGR